MKNKKQAVAVVLNAPSLNVPIEESFIICADGGYNLAVGICVPNVIVGDFDSIDREFPENLKKVVCPKEKDYTDGEKAIEYAIEYGYKYISIYGATGGRADHIYANLALLEFARTLGAEAIIKTEYETIYYKNKNDGKISFKAEKGTTVSVLPYTETVTVTDGYGLYYPYENLTINRCRSGKGISNVTIEDNFGFTISDGVALIMINRN